MTITYVSYQNPTQQVEAPNQILEGLAKITSVAIATFLAMPAVIAAGVFTALRLVNLVVDVVRTGRFFDACEFQGNLLAQDLKQIGGALVVVSSLPLNMFYYLSGVSPVNSLPDAPRVEVLEDEPEILALEDLEEVSFDEPEEVMLPAVEKEDFSEREVRVLVSPHAAPVELTVRGDTAPTRQEVIAARRAMLNDPDLVYEANPFADVCEF